MGLKYRNKPIVAYGIKFASQLEKYCYDLLTTFKIPFEFQQYVVLIPACEFHGKKNSASRMRIDFLLEHNLTPIYIDTKGFPTPVAELKFKLLEYNLSINNPTAEVVWLKNKKEVTSYVINLKKRYYGSF